MRLMALDTIARSVCLPFGIQWRQERMEIDGRKDFSIYAFSPVNSSPVMYASYIDKDDEGNVNNLLLEPRFNPESDAVVAIHISSNASSYRLPWNEMRESHVASMNWRYDLLYADPDTLRAIDRGFREMMLQHQDSSLKGKAWVITTRSGVDWAYELWVRRIEHTKQVRAGISAITEQEENTILIAAQWLRRNLPQELDEVRSDSLFVIFNEVVESFKWAE